jgi:hypothetical protein
MIIVWSDEAPNTYDNAIDDLIDKWEIEVVLDFETKTNLLLDHLKNYKKFCPPSKKKKLRKCVIHKNTSLVYKINKNNIELVTFVDNHNEHSY